MQKDSILENKKGEVSETMTWVFATIIIIVLIFLFLFAVNLLGQQRNLNFGLKIEDSGVANQEMLFGILNNGVNGKKINEMIVLGESEIAKNEIGKILSDFAYYNVRCDFYVSGDKGFSVRKGGSGKEVFINLGEKVVSLKC